MSHPLIIYPPGTSLLLPPRLLSPAGYYALLSQYHHTVVAWGGRYDRADKDTHRFTIADTRGPLTLTVPVARPEPGARWCDVVLSDHGRWQETMPTALESAYGRTPFFEFYADRLLPVISQAKGGDRLMDFSAALDSAVCRILGLTDQKVEHSPAALMKRKIPPLPVVNEYWQIRADRLGFISGLSILDLIFNLGPEAPLRLQSVPLTL